MPLQHGSPGMPQAMHTPAPPPIGSHRPVLPQGSTLHVSTQFVGGNGAHGPPSVFGTGAFERQYGVAPTDMHESPAPHAWVTSRQQTSPTPPQGAHQFEPAPSERHGDPSAHSPLQQLCPGAPQSVRHAPATHEAGGVQSDVATQQPTGVSQTNVSTMSTRSAEASMRFESLTT